MSIINTIEARKQREDKRHDAITSAAIIAQMDLDAREDLITYLQAFNEAHKAGDKQEMEYLANAILEIFQIDSGEDAGDLDEWESNIRASAAGQAAEQNLGRVTDHFFETYHKLKAKCNLTTIRKVAKAAGLSPTTVQAIEKQRVKPQFKTVQALAKAFHVDPSLFNRT